LSGGVAPCPDPRPALGEIGNYLNLADGLGLIDQETGKQLEGLQARANFYVTKVLFSLLEPPAQG
jgi:hypothetical protein